MNSGDLIPGSDDGPEPASSEVEFALVIARMIDTVKNSPADMRQVVYELARYKLREQFTHAEAKEIGRTQQALETAICGVEEFSRQQARIPPPAALTETGYPDVVVPTPSSLPPASVAQFRSQHDAELDSESAKAVSRSLPWAFLSVVAAVTALLLGLVVAVVQRDQLATWIHHVPKLEAQKALTPASAPAQVASTVVPDLAPKKPAAVLRPKDYGVYAVGQDSFTALQLLPGRSPDIRVAVSAAIKSPSQTILPNGHPKFLVFRRDVVSSISDRIEVRIIAKVAREFSPEAAGKKPNDGDQTWVIRNVAFPFRAAPIDDDPDMYEIHSENPELELTPGRYALILKDQSYDFTVEGKTVDPRQCIERIISSSGTYYSDCKEP